MRNEIKNWVDQSFDDLDTAKANLKIKKYYASVFFCQQAVEKALKALIIYNTKSASDAKVFSHSLIFLGKGSRVPAKFHTFLRELTPHYALTRYPDASEVRPS